jgi:hypothetical protein
MDENKRPGAGIRERRWPLPAPIDFGWDVVDGAEAFLGVSSGTALLVCGLAGASVGGALVYRALEWNSRPKKYNVYKDAQKALRAPMSTENYCMKYRVSQAALQKLIDEGQVRSYSAEGLTLIEDAAPLRLRRQGKEAARYLENPVHVARYCEDYKVTEPQVNDWISRGEMAAYEDANGLFVADRPPPTTD